MAAKVIDVNRFGTEAIVRCSFDTARCGCSMMILCISAALIVRRIAHDHVGIYGGGYRGDAFWQGWLSVIDRVRLLEMDILAGKGVESYSFLFIRIVLLLTVFLDFRGPMRQRRWRSIGIVIAKSREVLRVIVVAIEVSFKRNRRWFILALVRDRVRGSWGAICRRRSWNRRDRGGCVIGLAGTSDVG